MGKFNPFENPNELNRRLKVMGITNAPFPDNNATDCYVHTLYFHDINNVYEFKGTFYHRSCVEGLWEWASQWWNHE